MFFGLYTVEDSKIVPKLGFYGILWDFFVHALWIVCSVSGNNKDDNPEKDTFFFIHI